MLEYVDGPLFAGLLANERLVNVTTRDFALLPAPTAVTTRGGTVGVGA
jgi:hypothetical protein